MPEAAAPVAASAPSPAPKLDDVMLAMDVVDTLRHQETVVARELDEANREAALIERLRALYRSQGIDVPDRILREGVQALKESRFLYTPPPPSLKRTLALAWVRRASWGKSALAAAILLGGFLVGREVFVAGPERRAADQARVELMQVLPRDLESAWKDAHGEAQSQPGRARADQHLADGRAALARGDAAGARRAVGDLRALAAQLRLSYQLLIVARPGQPVGVFRVPERNRAARNHYLIVDAIGPDGRPVETPVTSEETNVTKAVSRWGVRVPEATWQAVGRDRNDDGIIQRNKVGEKRRGQLDVDYAMPVIGGAILEW